MSDCLFCKMVSGEISPDRVMETPSLLAFRDIAPQAPSHILIIPKRHIATINDLLPKDAELVGEMFLMASDIAREQGFSDAGYRVLMNCNRDGGQAVYHIHLHLLAGRQLHWPPG